MATEKQKKPKRWEMYKMEWELPELRTNEAIGLYPRQSTMKQVKNNTQSFEKQTQDAKYDLIRRGWSEILIKVYDQDMGRSAARPLENREAMNQMVTDIRDKVIRTVRASEVDRLFRDEDRIDSNLFIKVCREAGCLVMTDRMTYDFRLPRHVKWFRDEVDRAWEFYESQILIRAHELKDRARSQGYYTGGPVAVGYIVDKDKRSQTYKKIRPYQPMAERVIELFKWFYDCGGIFGALTHKLEHLPCIFPLEEDWVRDEKRFTTNMEYAYGTELDEEGKPKPIGYSLSIPGLKRILRNRVYMGEWLYDGEYIPNNHLPIVPLELFDFAQERLDASAEAFTRNYYTETFSVLHPLLYPVAPKGVKRYLIKRNEKNYFEIIEPRGLSNKLIGSINLDVVENIFVERFTEQLRNTSLFENYHEKISIQEEGSIKRKDNIKELIGELTEKIDGIFLTLQSPHLEKEDREAFIVARNKHIQRKKKLEEEIKIQTPMETYMKYKDLLEVMGKHWEKFPFGDRQALSALLIKGASLERLSSHFWRLVLEWKAFPEDVAIIWSPISSSPLWTTKEVELLKEMYPTEPTQEILDALPTHSWKAIICKAHGESLSRKKQYTGLTPKILKFSQENIKLAQEFDISIENLSGHTHFVQWLWQSCRVRRSWE